MKFDMCGKAVKADQSTQLAHWHYDIETTILRYKVLWSDPSHIKNFKKNHSLLLGLSWTQDSTSRSRGGGGGFRGGSNSPLKNNVKGLTQSTKLFLECCVKFTGNAVYFYQKLINLYNHQNWIIWSLCHCCHFQKTSSKSVYRVRNLKFATFFFLYKLIEVRFVRSKCTVNLGFSNPKIPNLRQKVIFSIKLTVFEAPEKFATYLKFAHVEILIK